MDKIPLQSLSAFLPQAFSLTNLSDNPSSHKLYDFWKRIMGYSGALLAQKEGEICTAV